MQWQRSYICFEDFILLEIQAWKQLSNTLHGIDNELKLSLPFGLVCLPQKHWEKHLHGAKTVPPLSCIGHMYLWHFSVSLTSAHVTHIQMCTFFSLTFSCFKGDHRIQHGESFIGNHINANFVLMPCLMCYMNLLGWDSEVRRRCLADGWKWPPPLLTDLSSMSKMWALPSSKECPASFTFRIQWPLSAGFGWL